MQLFDCARKYGLLSEMESLCRRVEAFYLPQYVVEAGFTCKNGYGKSRFIPLTTLSVAALEVTQEEVDSAFISRVDYHH